MERHLKENLQFCKTKLKSRETKTVWLELNKVAESRLVHFRVWSELRNVSSTNRKTSTQQTNDSR